MTVKYFNNYSLIKRVSFLLFLLCFIVANGQQTLTIEGKVTDADTKASLANISVTLSAPDTIVKTKTDAEGKYTFSSPLLKINKIYVLAAGADNPGYGYSDENEYFVSTYGLGTISRTYERNIKLRKSVATTQAPAPDRHVQFPFRQSVLAKPEKDTALNMWLQYLKNNPTYVVEINGNCDKKEGNKSLRIMISRARAQECIDYLATNGIPEKRMRLAGNGSNNPVVSNSAIRKIHGKDAKMAARLLNCRAEIVLKNVYFAPPPVIYVSGRVTDINTMKPLNRVLVKLTGTDGTRVTTETDSMGRYSLVVNSFSPLVTYSEVVTTLGYNALEPGEVFKITPATRDEYTYYHNFNIQKNGYEKPFMFFPVIFDSSSDRLNQIAIDSLTKVKKLMTERPGLVIEFMGDADWHETDYITLSRERAQVCVNYLVSQGIDSARFVVASRVTEAAEKDKNKSVKGIVKKQEKKTPFNRFKCNATFWIIKWDYGVIHIPDDN